MSCEDQNVRLNDGVHKAYIECHNVKSNKENDIAAQVEVVNVVIKKIMIPENNNVINFDMWETENPTTQIVYSTRDEYYRVYIIPE